MVNSTASTWSPRRGLSIFLQTPRDDDPAQTYADAIDAVRLAESLRFEIAWLAEAHFASIGLPSALTLITAAAQHTTNIRLGTAVVPIVFDHPVRLAETAALTNVLSGDRLELGVGKSNGRGFSSSAFSAFNLPEKEKEVLYDSAYAELRNALEGTIEGEDGPLAVYPTPRPLLSRTWQATATASNAEKIGRVGDGLLLHRGTSEGNLGEVQSSLIDHYLDALTADRLPRIGVSRAVLPAASRAEGQAIIQEEFSRNPSRYTGFGATTVDEFLERSNIYYGSADEIAEQLNADAAAARSTDYLFSIPLPSASAAFREGLRIIAEEIYPQLPVARRQLVR